MERPAATAAPCDYEDDDVLVTALRAGDEAAFAWLLDRYDTSLRRLARTCVATPSAAEEVVQETWLAVIEGIDRFERRSSLRTWVHSILFNKARTRGVADKRSVPFSSVGPSGGGPAGDGLGPAFPAERFLPDDHPAWPGHWASPPPAWETLPAARLEAHETLAAVRAAIAALPMPHRAVIALRDVEGWSSAEVCDALGLTPANQRVVLHRARARVRTAIERHLTEATP